MANELSPAELVTLLAREQRQCWQQGQRILAETYLKRHATLEADLECFLELVHREVTLRQEFGEVPQVAEYQQRFPQLASELQRLFDTYQARKASSMAHPEDRIGPGDWPALRGFEIFGELGRGGMGIVYRARQLGAGRLVALKMLRSGKQANAEELERFRDEAKKLGQLKHGNIVEVYEVQETDGRPYFAMELIEGGTLAQVLGHGPLRPTQAAELVATLARAVHHAHEQGIMHRDLKPANILIDAGQRPHITDFGLAKWLEMESGQTQTGDILGTPSYMAPEQASGARRLVGKKSDIYALGVILYETLTGRPPFHGTTPLDTLRQVTDDEPIPPSQLNAQVPRDLETICLKCLEKEVALGRRYESALTLAEDLQRFLDHEPIRAARLGLAGRLRRWSRRNPVVAGLAVALAVIVVGSLIGMFSLWRHAEHQRARAEASVREMKLGLKDLVLLYNRNVKVLKRANQLAEAIPAFQKMMELGEKLLQTDPEDLAMRRVLGQIDFSLGLAFRDLRRYAEAVEPMRQAVAHQRAVWERSQDPSGDRVILNQYYFDLRHVYLQQGQVSEAAATALERRKLWTDESDQIVDAACELGMCMKAVSQNKTRLQADDEAEMRRYGDQAMAILHQVVDRGYRDFKYLRDEKDLELLRSRADFQELLADMEQRARLATEEPGK